MDFSINYYSSIKQELSSDAMCLWIIAGKLSCVIWKCKGNKNKISIRTMDSKRNLIQRGKDWFDAHKMFDESSQWCISLGQNKNIWKKACFHKHNDTMPHEQYNHQRSKRYNKVPTDVNNRSYNQQETKPRTIESMFQLPLTFKKENVSASTSIPNGDRTTNWLWVSRKSANSSKMRVPPQPREQLGEK